MIIGLPDQRIFLRFSRSKCRFKNLLLLPHDVIRAGGEGAFSMEAGSPPAEKYLAPVAYIKFYKGGTCAQLLHMCT